MCVYVCECMYEHFLIVPSQPYRPGFKSFRQSPPWSLWPPRPPRPPWASHKSPQCYSNNRPRDKEHIYTSGAFFESKKALFGRFPNSPLPPKKKKKNPEPPLPLHTPPLNSIVLKKVHHSSDGDVGAKYTTPSPIPPANPQAPPI